MILAGMTAPQLDTTFATKLGAETHFIHGGFKVDAKKPALDAALVKALQLGPGEWFAAGRVELNADVTAYVAFKRSGSASLIVVERAKAKVSEVFIVADFSRLEGAYEKTTSAWLRVKDKKVTLTISVFLRDFEFEDPSVPGTKNITGDTVNGFELRGTKFEMVSATR